MQNHIHTQRRAIARADLLAAAILLFVLSLAFFLLPAAHGQTLPAPAPGDLALAAAPAAESAPVLPFAVPGWVMTALSIFGAVSIAYQAVIAWAHERAAATADPADDQWIASLEKKAWFRILDRLFYWGGYVGAKLGGKKL
jgi:hypothetical protein